MFWQDTGLLYFVPVSLLPEVSNWVPTPVGEVTFFLGASPAFPTSPSWFKSLLEQKEKWQKVAMNSTGSKNGWENSLRICHRGLKDGRVSFTEGDTVHRVMPSARLGNSSFFLLPPIPFLSSSKGTRIPCFYVWMTAQNKTAFLARECGHVANSAMWGEFRSVTPGCGPKSGGVGSLCLPLSSTPSLECEMAGEPTARGQATP